MKTKSFLSILVFVIYFAAPAFAQFPLEMGNRWDFVEGWWDGYGNGSADTVVYRIISDTVLQNGKTYFKVLPEGILFRNLIRSDSIGIYYYDSVCDTEWLFYGFDIPIGEPVKVPLYFCDTTNSPEVYKTSVDSVAFFGNIVNSIKYTYIGGIDNWYNIMITHDYGFINWESSSISENYYKHLIGCELDGIVYGTLTVIDPVTNKLNEYSLEQNYPNPFNSITNIDFEIPFRQGVKLKLYDILGNEIEELLNEERDAGKHRIKFDSAELSSGVYIYQLQTNSKMLFRKMILLK